ncbi:MAG TPA: glycoside hydrolase family 2 TIM barrel-domain containing protein [Gemmatimonadaceae bacterium]
MQYRRRTWVPGPALAVALAVASPALLDAQSVSSADARFAHAARARYAINEGWRYREGGVNLAESLHFPDESWERVSLPHTWNARDPFDDAPSYRRGIGWYRKTLSLDSALRGKRIFLHFEGANQVAAVYVNGAFAGEHRGGYTAFTFDISKLVRFDGGKNDNVVAVQVNNAHDPFIPPLSVGYALYGGIYRDAWLVATDPVHVTLTDHGGPGVYVSTPAVTQERGTVAVRGAVSNDGATAKHLRIVSTLVDAAGREVARDTAAVDVGARKESAWSQTLPAIARPHLWSPEDPYLYIVRTDVYDGDALRDRVSNSLGFRWYRFDPHEGFFLNGAKYQIHGTNRHQDYAGLGSALPNAFHERDMQLIKEMGANFVRLAHYPQDPAVLDAADRIGLLIWEEIPVVNYITPRTEFTATAENMLREMIRQHFNHPSVILWGTMNEVFLWSPEGARIRAQTDTTYMREVHDYAARVDSLARCEDPTRLTTMAIHISGDYEKSGVANVSQVLGLNIYDGWYSGTFDGFGTQLDKHHARLPDRVLFVSEYGAEDDYRVNSLHPERFDFSGTYMRRYHESYLQQIAARPWLAGTAIWNEFDFSQPETGGSIPYMNQKGMLTWDRKPKDVYYLYKANWNPQPMVYIASRGWTNRLGTDPAARPGAGLGVSTQPVDVYSNLARVELFVNGRSLGAKTPNDVKRATWDVPFRDGDNVIEAHATKDGRRYDDRLVVHMTYRAPRLDDASVPFRALGVNAGSRAQVVDPSGEVWEGDQPYAPGSFGYVGGTAAMVDKDLPIKGDAVTPLFITHHRGLSAYRFDVADGTYDVELLFAEPSVGPGERVFDVAVNGAPYLRALDLSATYGIGRAARYTTRATATDGQGIVVTFTATKGEPILNAIHVTRR